MKKQNLNPALEGKIIEIYKRHNENAKKLVWNYHEYLPWERGKNFKTLPWSPDQRTLPEGIVTALETSMLTEINLPWYTAYLNELSKGTIPVLGEFLHTWTSEEDQHASALENYLSITRSTDPKKLDSLKKQMLFSGWEPHLMNSALETVMYTAVQELGTVVFYQNVASVTADLDPDLSRLLMKIAKDESLHYAFYNQVVQVHLESNPEYVIDARNILLNFDMPGAVIADYDKRMEIIAEKAKYGPIEYFDQVLDVLVRRWKIEELKPISIEGENARQEILKHHKKMKRIRDIIEKKKIK